MKLLNNFKLARFLFVGQIKNVGQNVRRKFQNNIKWLQKNVGHKKTVGQNVRRKKTNNIKGF